jgi:hypothetical protein
MGRRERSSARPPALRSGATTTGARRRLCVAAPSGSRAGTGRAMRRSEAAPASGTATHATIEALRAGPTMGLPWTWRTLTPVVGCRTTMPDPARCAAMAPGAAARRTSGDTSKVGAESVQHTWGEEERFCWGRCPNPLR